MEKVAKVLFRDADGTLRSATASGQWDLTYAIGIPCIPQKYTYSYAFQKTDDAIRFMQQTRMLDSRWEIWLAEAIVVARGTDVFISHSSDPWDITDFWIGAGRPRFAPFGSVWCESITITEKLTGTFP